MNIDSNQQTLILVYHDFRGMAQIIRYIVLYLKIPFEQILLKKGQKVSQLKILKQKTIQDSLELPFLMDQVNCIQNVFPIICYLCKRAGRQDLLGQSTEQRSIIRQIFYNTLLSKSKQMRHLFKFWQKASGCLKKKEEIRKIAMKQSHQHSDSVIPLAKLKIRNSNGKYLLGHITVLDFLFFEESFYQLNFFGNLEIKGCIIYDAIKSIFKNEDQNSLYLKTMREFRENFQNQPFYAQNKLKLESYSILCPAIKPFVKEAFKKAWIGPEHYCE